MKRFFLGSLLLLICSQARAQYSSTTLRGVDAYRTEQVTADQIRGKLGPLLTEYVRLRFEGRKSHIKDVARLKNQIDATVRAMGKFAYCELYYGEYFTSAERTAYVTFDLVDAKDAKERMPFRPVPNSNVEDPGGLIAVWQQYDGLGASLEAQGVLSIEERPDCSGNYCKWGSSTPQLAALEQKLAPGAQTHKAALKKAAFEDADPARRAAALYVLSYLPDAGEAAKIATAGLEDPAAEPRSAALAILSDIAIYHKSTVVDIGRLIAVLDYPTVTDRSKALGLLVALADSSAYKSYLLTRATPKLLALLKLDQPANHDLAFTLLSVLSQESYGPRDYDAWENWISNHDAPAPAQADKKNGR